MPTKAELQQYVDRIWAHTFQTDITDTLTDHLRTQALVGVKRALETALVEELTTYLGTVPYGRATSERPLNAGARSGYYQRQVLTTHGSIPDLCVPTLRYGNRERPWQILTRYQCAMQQVLDQALYRSTLGLSIRDLQAALYLVFGHVLSRDAVNRVTIAAQSGMDAWRNQPLDVTPPVLLIDGVWVQVLLPTGATWVDRSGHERQEVRGQERVVLTAMGVWPDGRHQILHYLLAETEDTAAWGTRFTALVTRGLDPTAVQVVVSDGSTGVPAALATHMPQAQQQRCTVHTIRGSERALLYRDLPTHDPVTQEPLTGEQARRHRRVTFTTEAHAIFAAPTRAEAEQRLVTFQIMWATREPEAVRRLLYEVQDCLTFYACEPTMYQLVRSTNLLERFFREFRTKADEIGAFPNPQSCLTVFHLIVVRDHAKHGRDTCAKTG